MRNGGFPPYPHGFERNPHYTAGGRPPENAIAAPDA